MFHVGTKVAQCNERNVVPIFASVSGTWQNAETYAFFLEAGGAFGY